MFLFATPKMAMPDYCEHQYLWGFFDAPAGSDRPFLYRDLGSYFMVLSRIRPNVPCKDISKKITAGRSYAFDLIASPQRGCSYRDKSGNRVTIKRAVYSKPNEIREWFLRRLCGAEPKFNSIAILPPLKIIKHKNTITVSRTHITGVIKVHDRSKFIDMMLRGVGPKGCWGCSMMVLPEIMREELSYEAA